MRDWLWMGAADLGRGIDAGEIDAEALCETFLDAIGDSAVGERIYARVTPERARAEAAAAAARARAGLRRGPLDGVPVSWKDLFDSAGVETAAGSALLAGRVPEADAEVLRAATLGGAVCLGKTHMSELAFSGLGLNPVTATPPNRNDPRAVPGGSSSGAAASVAFGLAPLAIGSDTGGSVRVPAAWNDLVGLKTSMGRLSNRGMVPLVASLDTVGPLARSVEDAALALALLDGGRAPDLTGATVRGARILIPADFTDGTRDAPAAAFAHAVERMRDAGARVERQAIPQFEAATEASAAIFGAESWGEWGKAIDADPDAMFARIRDRFRLGRSVSGADHVRAWDRMRALRSEVAVLTAGYDAIALPTSPILPPDAARLLEDDDYYVSKNLLTLRHTRVGNVLDFCGLSLPTGVPSCGLMLLCPAGQEARLLRLGAAVEAALA